MRPDPGLPEPPVDLGWISALPPGTIYLAVAVLAAVKAFLPPVPIDSFLVVAAVVLVAQGEAAVGGLVAAVCAGASLGTLAAYETGRRIGPGLLVHPVVSRLIRPGWVMRARELERRRGSASIFLLRLVPGVRHVVPPLSGASGIPRSVAAPALVAGTCTWYGVLLLGGGWTGEWIGARGDEEGGIPADAILVAAALLLLLVVLRLVARRRGRVGEETDG